MGFPVISVAAKVSLTDPAATFVGASDRSRIVGVIRQERLVLEAAGADRRRITRF